MTSGSWQVILEKCPITDLKTAIIKLERVSLPSLVQEEKTSNLTKIAPKMKNKKGRPRLPKSMIMGDKKDDKCSIKEKGSGPRKPLVKEEEIEELPDYEKIRIKNIQDQKVAFLKKEIEELPDYEKIRIKNIQEQKAKFLDELKKSARALNESMKPKPKAYTPNPNYRRKRIVRKNYFTRSSKQNSNGSPQKMATENEYSSDEEYVELPSKRRRSAPHTWAFNPNENILQPEDITEAMLNNVYEGGSKVYRTSHGTTCHQCRQKTSDQKTVCRSGNCAGVRGMFCSNCLRNRYGQDIREALKDRDWWCPPCLDICNCSICRARIGKGATGIMTQYALSKGFASVHHLLASGKEE